MGSSCSSTHRIQEPNMKNLPPSPTQAKPKNGNVDIGLKSQCCSFSHSTLTFTPNAYNNGTKEEAFFDSKAWFDSDCEDDFYSVNGEFTPSCGSTPVHHTFRTPIADKNPSNKSVIPGSVPELSSPKEKKKSLLELFRESVREQHQGGDNIKKGLAGNENENKQVKPIIQDFLPKSHSSGRTTYVISRTNSARTSERTMNVDHENVREKSVKSGHRCLPSLAYCRSFSERRRKTSSAVEANGKA